MTREILKCSECGKLATHGCERSGQWICGAPLCDDETCIEKHIRRVHPHYLKDWSVERMNDLISRNALLKDIKGMILCDIKTRDWVVDIIQHQPTAYDVDRVALDLALEKQTYKPIKVTKPSSSMTYVTCLSCGKFLDDRAKDNYCHGCGQKLDWSVEE